MKQKEINMSIKHAALSLNEFYKTVHQLPDSILKAELEGHVQEMVASMLKSCLVRNQQKNFSLNVQHYQHNHVKLSKQWENIFNLSDKLYG
ncbi:MAG: hypothetical protein K0Q57_246 [Gammaproteobacteria bacterium]|jgi:hypothetical protein|nr:hypothetical protein [Gammaproteobacteria bacterium]